MTRKIVGIGDPGSSITWGTDDGDYINKYLTGVDQSGVDPVTIATTTTFKNTKLQISNPGGSFSHIINGGSITANFNASMPAQTADDVFAMNNTIAVMKNKDMRDVSNQFPAAATNAISGSAPFAIGTNLILSITGLTVPRTFTFPDVTDTVETLTATQSPTNKTYNATNNTITDTSTALGDILKSNGTKFLRLARGTANQVLQVNAGATDIAWTTPASALVIHKGKATFNGTGSQTIFAIAHTIGALPTGISVTPATSQANLGQSFPTDLEGANYWVTADATNITITFGKAPAAGASNVIFWWVAIA